MAAIDIHYGVIFGKCDASDWIDWTVEVSDEEYEIYNRDVMLRIDPNEDDRLSDCLSRAYEEIEAEEIDNGIGYDDEYVLECTGQIPVDPDEINDLVANRDHHALEFFGLLDMTDDELDEWDANDLDELPNVCDFEENFEAESPFDAGWTLRVEFEELPSLTLEEAESTLRILFKDNNYSEVVEYIDNASDYAEWREDVELENLAKEVAADMGCLEEYEDYLER